MCTGLRVMCNVYEATVLVLARWRQLPRYQSSPRQVNFLKKKFGDRIISSKTDHHWPPYSPDKSLLNSAKTYLTVNLKKRQPSTIESLTRRCSPGALENPNEYLHHIKVLTDASTVQIRALIDCHMFQISI